MNLLLHPSLQTVIMAMLGTLTSVSILNFTYGRTGHAEKHPDFYRNLKQRIGSWWGMAGIFLISCLLGKIATILLFAAVSFLALREMITQMKTRRADHGSLSWAFFVILPVQYILIATGQLAWFSIFVPVVGLAILVIRNLLAGEAKGFLSKTAEIYLAVMICVYSVGHVPALTSLGSDSFTGIGLLVFFVVAAQACDVLQFMCGKLTGRHKLSPNISPNKTIEGAVGGIVLTAALGAGLSMLTPFIWWQAALLAGLIGLCGLFGDLLMSAIKRDLGIKDFSQLIPGHGGVLDRVDSMVIAGPVFFYVAKLLLA